MDTGGERLLAASNPLPGTVNEQGRDRLSGKLYLRPVGIVWGETATEALAQQMALPLAGGPASCLAFELIEGAPGNTMRRIMSARDAAASTDTAIRASLARITAPRAAIAGLQLQRPLIMGIVNVTPDSFSDGGDFGTQQSAIAHAHRLSSEGADIVDIGGESTRPGAPPVDEAEEMRRVLPVIGGLRDLGKPISIDTRKARIMELAVQGGAAMINDVSALCHDPRSAAVAASLGRPLILMHAQGDPRTMQDNPFYDDVLLEVYDFLEGRIAAAEAAGVTRGMLSADPGIGFGKTVAHNLALVAGISLFHGLGVPVMLGASRKRFIGSITGESDPKQRVSGSIGVALAGIAQGVQMLRVHDVAPTRQALDCWLASR
jgi:dihydropteroate synthase